MRVLSPRIEPPVRVELGSTARTATRLPEAVSCEPRVSIVVDLPTPGTPGNADAQGLARIRQDDFQQFARRLAAILAAGFHQCDRPRQSGAITGLQALCEILDSDGGPLAGGGPGRLGGHANQLVLG